MLVPDKRVKDCFDYQDEIGELVDGKLEYFSKHTPIRKIYESWDEDKYAPFDGYHKIGTVRNPWARLVSLYEWKEARFRKEVGFLSFIKNKAPLLSCCNSFRLNNKIVIDDYIRLENLQEDFAIICDKIGLPRQQLPHKNKTKHKHYTKYYDDEARDAVARRFREDIEMFGYEFGKDD